MRLPIAKIEDMTEPDHDALSNVYFDKEHGELIASDGFGMVVIPVGSGDKDVSGCIPSGVIQVAREHGASVELHDSTKARVKIKEGALWQRRHEGYSENARERISEILAGEDNCTIISLDAERLVRLAKALLDGARHGDCRITLKIHGEEEPILIRPYYDKVWDSRFGIIMPLAGRGGK